MNRIRQSPGAATPPQVSQPVAAVRLLGRKVGVMLDVFKKTLYTLVLARHTGTKIWRLSLTFPVLVSFFSLALLGITLAGMAIRNYVDMLNVVSEHRRLRSENDALRA